MTDAVDPLFLEFQAAVAGRYSLVRELGRGGMGVVYLAREVRLDRLVAIKVLPPAFDLGGSLRERFLREARTSARLSHPNIVPIFTVDEAGAFVFFAMAYVEGETLAQRLLAHGPLSANDASRILREVAWALGHAHAEGIVHRDVKPANILLERGTGRALVADFGIARATSVEGITLDGERLGTPEYMSPEQASDGAIDGRSDIYSLGVVGFVLVTGRLPFQGDSAHDILRQHVASPAPLVSSFAPGVRRSLGEAVDRCLSKDPSERWNSASALADALATAIETPVEVPLPVRVFLDNRRVAGPVALGAILAYPEFAYLAGWMPPVETWVTVMWATFAVVGLLTPLAVLTARLRALRKVGYGAEDLARALRDSFHRKREEFRFEFGAKPGRIERALRWVAGISGAAAIYMPTLGVPVSGPGVSYYVIAIMALGLFIASGTGSIALAINRYATDSMWARFWTSRVGRWWAKIAGKGVAAVSIPLDRPTEVAIAISAEALFAELPAATRAGLGELPAVVTRLRERASVLRGRLAALEQAPELRDERDAAQSQLTQTVSALETLRLDLLRLSVGTMTIDGVTADLATVREIGREAERLIAAKREVDRAVGPISPNPA